MSSVVTRLGCEAATIQAERFRENFGGTYTRWEFAGSLRRGRPDVGDIEHVVVPITADDLFGQRGELKDHLVRAQATRLICQKIAGFRLHNYGGHTRFGPRYMGLDVNGRLHEVFCADADNLGCILAIRTGPVSFSRQLMIRLRERGYRMHAGRLLVIVQEDRASDADSVRLDDGRVAKVVRCPDEKTLFRAAGYDGVIPPRERY